MVKHILRISNIALIAVSVFFGVQFAYGILTGKLEERILLSQLKIQADAQGRSGGADKLNTPVKSTYSAYEAIAQRDLFMTKAAETTTAAATVPVVEELEKTTLKLKLWGTITGNDRGNAYAVIEDTANRRRQSQELYREGDRVGEAVIKHILRERVVLSVAGRNEVLEMEQVSEIPGRQSAAMAQDSPGSHPRLGLQDGPGEEFFIQRDVIEEAVSDIGNLMRQVRVRPYFEDGNPEGVLLSGVRRNSIFDQMGLRSGDILKGVNGNPIRSVDDAMALYQELRSAHNVQLQIERDGSPQSISYRIN